MRRESLARSMMASHHPEGDAACPGGRIRYWLRSSEHGILGGLTAGAASWHHKARDLHIGWSQAARDANIGRVVNNDRFLILPGVRVYGLASLALALFRDRVADDWEGRYGGRPELAYSYVGPEHTGASYRAAGWTCCKEPASGKDPGPRLRVYVKPLSAGWREVLGREPERVIGGGPPLVAREDPTWAEREYGRSAHSDARVRERLVMMGGAWCARVRERPLPVIFPGEAEQKAAYRFLSNPRIGVRDILEPHQEAMAERCRRQPVVLAVQDTTNGELHRAEGDGGSCRHRRRRFRQHGARGPCRRRLQRGRLRAGGLPSRCRLPRGGERDGGWKARKANAGWTVSARLPSWRPPVRGPVW